jgi:enoyl-CoA hydratase/carnithine racemase
MSPSNPFLLRESRGGVLIVSMNSPETRNAISDLNQMQEFVELARDVRDDPAVRVVVLTGLGPSFCAGGNIKDMRDGKGMFAGSAYDIRGSYRRGIQRIPLALYDLDAPIIAAVNGPAIGAGLDLACMCDIRLCSDTAKFAESFVKLGIVPGDGGAWFLPRIIGMPKATIMAFSGETIDAEQALQWDLVTSVTTPADLMPAALDLAARVAQHPSHALRLTKRLLREGQYMRLESLLELSAAYQARSHRTEDHKEAISAFINKRAPDFKNT